MSQDFMLSLDIMRMTYITSSSLIWDSYTNVAVIDLTREVRLTVTVAGGRYLGFLKDGWVAGASWDWRSKLFNLFPLFKYEQDYLLFSIVWSFCWNY